MSFTIRAFRPKRLKGALRRRSRQITSQLNTRHIWGPRKFHLGPEEVCGILLGRNISYYIPEFMEHHRGMGMNYLIYMDNGSDDDSVERLRTYDNVIILSNTLNFRDYQPYMRSQAATRYVEGGWRLALDADEILRFPGDDHIDLPELARRMTARGQTGLVAQMLELVPDGPLSAVATLSYPEVRKVFRNYSTENITAYRYHDETAPHYGMLRRNSVADPQVSFLFGGLRRTLFAEDCCLSKHVFFRSGPEVIPLMNPHVTMGLHCADFTAALHHYKFSGDFLEREKRRLTEKRLSHKESDLRLAAFARDPAMSLSFPGIQHDPTPAKLLEAGFLTASADARQMLGMQ
ncbi:MAG: glycosyltransferase family 2 protein [Tropicimonas sp.]|uniref:glycosyltransferase family 2 protein n=1 Tax=Tropicimonas sp. TaxID=2067044 RepID=UPI003A8A65D3